MLARIKQGKGPSSCFVSYERASHLIVLPAQQPAAHRKSGTFSDKVVSDYEDKQWTLLLRFAIPSVLFKCLRILIPDYQLLFYSFICLAALICF